MKNKFLFSVLCLLFILILADPPSEGLSQEIRILRLGIRSDPVSLDPATSEDPSLVRQLFLGLVDVDEAGNVVPQLAVGWDTSEDSTAWVFFLRDDVSWVDSNGVNQGPVTAHDAVFALDRFRLLNQNGGVFDIIEGVEAPDDFTLSVYLKMPVAYFPAILAMPETYPVPGAIVDNYGNGWSTPRTIWTNGPYYLVDWQPEDSLILKVNPYWWGAFGIQIEEVHVRITGNDEIALELFNAGELDHVQIFDTGLWDEIRHDPAYSRFQKTPLRPLTYTFHLNPYKSPTDHPFVRQAFATGLDRQFLCYEVFGLGVPAQGLAPPGVFGSTQQNMRFDPNLGNDLLDEAGYFDTDGDGIRETPEGNPVTFHVIYTTPGDYHFRMAQAAARMWEANLGVIIDLEGMSLSDLFQILREEPFESDRMPHIWRLSWIPAFPDQHSWLYLVYHSEAQNDLNIWSNPDFDGIVQSAAIDPNQGVRLELYQIAEQILLREDPGVIPICHWTYTFLSKPNVGPTYSLTFGLGSISDWQFQPVPVVTEEPELVVTEEPEPIVTEEPEPVVTDEPEPEPEPYPPPTDEPGPTIPDFTKVVEQATVNVFDRVSDDQSELVFSDWTDELEDLDIDDIVVMDQNDVAQYGLLRRVTDIFERDGEIVLLTDPAALDEAIEEVEFQHTFSVGQNDVLFEEDLVSTSTSRLHLAKLSSADLEDAIKIRLDHVLHDEDGDHDTTNDQVKFNGTVTIKPDVEIKMKIDDFELKELTFITTVSEKTELKISSSIDIVNFNEKIPIKRFYFAPQTVLIGGFPVVITPQLTVYVGLKGNVSVGVETGITHEDTIVSGVEYYNDDWHEVLDNVRPEITDISTKLTHDSRAEAYAGPEFSFMLYGVAGPYIHLKGYLEMELDPLATSWWQLIGGFRSDAGIKIEIFSHIVAGYEAEIFDFSEVLLREEVEPVDPTNTPSIKAPTPTSPSEPDPNGPICCFSIGLPLLLVASILVTRKKRLRRI